MINSNSPPVPRGNLGQIGMDSKEDAQLSSDMAQLATSCAEALVKPVSCLQFGRNLLEVDRSWCSSHNSHVGQQSTSTHHNKKLLGSKLSYTRHVEARSLISAHLAIWSPSTLFTLFWPILTTFSPDRFPPTLFFLGNTRSTVAVHHIHRTGGSPLITSLGISCHCPNFHWQSLSNPKNFHVSVWA